MYGKLNDGNIIFAPRMLAGNGVNVYNPPAEMYASQGWKVVRTTQVQEAPIGYYYESSWEETPNEIIQIWTLKELPEELDDSEALSILLGGDVNE